MKPGGSPSGLSVSVRPYQPHIIPDLADLLRIEVPDGDMGRRRRPGPAGVYEAQKIIGGHIEVPGDPDEGVIIRLLFTRLI